MNAFEVYDSKPDILSMSEPELKALLDGFGEPSYRERQVFGWLHQKCAGSFSEMTNLPRKLREELSKSCALNIPKIIRKLISKTDGTVKYLFELSDGELIESVVMRYSYGLSICVSSQVGCKMGCKFCASGENGLKRNLSAGEMLGQVYAAGKDTNEKIGHVVVMGMGEPLLNYDSLVRFVRLLTDENALHISRRNITISTCGIIPAIYRLSKENLGVTLAVSLHAPCDEIRKRIMPIAAKYSMDGLLDACRAYFDETGRRVTFEYCLLSGINDSRECALLLSEKLKGMHAHVNLIPVNPAPGSSFRPPSKKAVTDFENTLLSCGVQVTKRRKLGSDIQGACGQLRRQSLKGSVNI